MKHLFVPYEIAVIAKEKGFDEPCFGQYLSCLERDTGIEVNVLIYDGVRPTLQENLPSELLNAPLYQQIVDWFKGKHLLITVDYTSMSYIVVDMRRQNCLHDTGGISTQDIDKAIEQAFKLI